MYESEGLLCADWISWRPGLGASKAGKRILLISSRLKSFGGEKAALKPPWAYRIQRMFSIPGQLARYYIANTT